MASAICIQHSNLDCAHEVDMQAQIARGRPKLEARVLGCVVHDHDSDRVAEAQEALSIPLLGAGDSEKASTPMMDPKLVAQGA
jgi:hypothetical protein